MRYGAASDISYNFYISVGLHREAGVWSDLFVIQDPHTTPQAFHLATTIELAKMVPRPQPIEVMTWKFTKWPTLYHSVPANGLGTQHGRMTSGYLLSCLFAGGEQLPLPANRNTRASTMVSQYRRECTNSVLPCPVPLPFAKHR